MIPISEGRLRRTLTIVCSLTLIGALIGNYAGLVGQWSLDMVGAVSFGWVFARLAEVNRTPLGASIAFGAAICAGVVGLKLARPDFTMMPYLLLVPANLLVAWMFARGLFPGREPILLRLIRLMDLREVSDPDFQLFVRRQCVLWTALSLVNAAVALAAVPLLTTQPWIADVLLILVVGQLLWFAVSHHYASLRYARPETWWLTARTMTRPEVFSRLTAP